MSSLYHRHLRVPKYLQLAEALRSQVTSGALKPGDRLPSFVQMRQRFGATQNTVEKVFGLLEREGLIVREPSRGTFVAPPNRTKNGTRTRTGIVGVAGKGFRFESNLAYWADLLRGMRSAAERADVQILLLDHESNRGWEKADGVLVCDWTAREIFGRLAPQQPCVSLLVDVPGRASVVADDWSGGYVATRHLLELGHRKIAYLHGGDSHLVPRRLAGYQQALAEAGITPDGRWTKLMLGSYRDNAEFSMRGRESTANWLRDGWKATGCTALLAHNDATAFGAIEAFENAGLKVPLDISVMGFDGGEVARRSFPPLSTVEVPLGEIGAQGMELLLRQIADDQVTQEHLVLPVRVNAQGTTAPPQSFESSRRRKHGKITIF